MKKRVVSFLIVSVLLVALVPVTASADTGPKPSVVLDFEGFEGQTYYVTLLSDVPSTGPHSALTDSGYSPYEEGGEDYDIFRKFLGYEDADGYYFLQYFQDCSQTHRFRWGYYPPSNFKILVYFPELDRFAVSRETYERYTFHSSFSVSMTDAEFSLGAVKNYDYTGEMLSLIARIALTIAAELLLALLFGFRTKKQFRLIAAVNLATQVALNIALNLINYSSGPMMFVFAYVLLELLVFVVEAVVYAVFLPQYDGAPISKRKAVAYALAANAASFGLGLWLARFIPGIF